MQRTAFEMDNLYLNSWLENYIHICALLPMLPIFKSAIKIWIDLNLKGHNTLVEFGAYGSGPVQPLKCSCYPDVFITQNLLISWNEWHSVCVHGVLQKHEKQDIF